MLEQIQSSTESTALAAAKGKTGKQGVFANLFKALAHKGTAGKAGKLGAASIAGQLTVGLKAGEEAEALKGALKGAEGKVIALKGVKTGEKTIKLHAAAEEGEAAALASDKSKTSKGTLSGLQHPKQGEQVAQAAETAKTIVRTVSETDEDIPTTVAKRAVTTGKHVATGKATHEADAIDEGKEATRQARTARVADDAQDQQPDIGLAQARVAASEPQTTGRAADKAPLQNASGHAARTGHQAETGTAKPAHETAIETPVEDVDIEIAHADKGKARAAAQSAARTGTEHETAQTAKQTNQAGALDQDSLQRDTDTVQRVREELASMANKAAGKSAQVSHAKARGNEGVQLNAHPAQAQVNHAQQAQVGTAAQAAGAQTAQAVTAAVTTESGQQGGKDAGTGRESADARLLGGVQTEARPQQAFDLQQQAAVRMAQPMRALEAMQSIAHSAANGTTKLEIQLEPAHLGKIHISLQTDAAKQLQMHLTVEHGMTRQVIEQHMPQLRAALEQHGLNLDNFSLHTGSHGQQQQQHAREYAATGFDAPETPADLAGNESNAPRTASHAGSRLSIHI